MARPAARQHTSVLANANDALPSSTTLPTRSNTLPPREREQQTKDAEPGVFAGAKHRRKSSLKNAKNSTEVLRARLRGDAARRRSPSDTKSGARKWAVGNIGHNGRLYLRPVIRPGNERSQPLAPPFANAQPRRSLLVADKSRTSKAVSGLANEDHLSRPGSPDTPPRLRRVDSSLTSNQSADVPPARVGNLQRSHSFSTIDNQVFARAEAPGTLRVVITRSRSHRDRHRRLESDDAGRLGVPIPSHRIGDVQFGGRGTPIIRSASQATNGNQYSDSIKSGHTSMIQASLGTQAHSVSRRHSEMSHSPAFVFRSSPDESIVDMSNSRLAVYNRERDFWAHAFVFDHLEAHPVDPSLIIHADFKGPKKRKIVFATPLTLVAQITSSTNVDYDLLSDFFMTFRQFMPKKKLLEYLHDRFLWAIARQGDVSTAVRVRTFVALRHWILNYMAEDFVPDYSLRADFCMLVNGLYDYLKEIGATGPRGLEQIAELKRCWRQYISLYFEDPYDEHASSHDAIQPGGRGGSDQELYELALLNQPTPVNPVDSEAPKNTDNSRFTQSDVRPQFAIGSPRYEQDVTMSRETHGTGLSEPAHARMIRISNSAANIENSQKSSMIWSCSIPFRPANPMASAEGAALGKQAPPRTVALPAHVTNPLRATRPKNVLQGTSNNLVVSNENRSPTEKTAGPGYKGDAQVENVQAVSPTSSAPGDLIKGRTLLPIAPNVEYEREKPKLDISDGSDKASTGTGVRRMIGSIRRAVSTSKQTQGPALRHAHLERHGDQLSTVTTTGHASMPSGTTSSSTPSSRPKTERILGPLHPRTDLLLERSLESFNKAVAAAPKLVTNDPPKVHEPLQNLGEAGGKRPSEHALSLPILRRGPSSGNLTIGSRSIVIGHEDSPPPLPEPPNNEWMSGGLSTPKIIHTDFDEAASDMAGFQAPLDDDEPIEVATDDGWQVDEPQWEMQRTSTDPLPSSAVGSSVYTSVPPSISGAWLGKEATARPAHQPSNSLDDPVLPEDPQPSRSLRRRNDRGNLRANLPSFQGRVAPQGILPDALGSHPPSRPSSPISMPDAEDLPPLPSPGVLGPSVEEQLKSMLFPDDPNEDGSPAAALMKLEGRYVDPPRARTSFDLDLAPENQPDHDDTQDKFRHRHEHVMDAHAPIHGPRNSPVLAQISPAVSPVRRGHRHNVSEVSYNSIPLLERGALDQASTGHQSYLRIRESESTESGLGYRLPTRAGQLRAINPDNASEDDGVEPVDEPEVLQGMSLEEMVSQSLAGAEQDRYHGIHAQHVSSQALSPAPFSFDMRGGAVRSYYEDGRIVDDATSEAMFHPLRHPSTPPGGDVDAYGVRVSNGLLTPANSPPSREPPKASYSAGVYVPTRGPKPAEEIRPQPRPAVANAKHSAFILRFRAEHIAKAMTVVEQSALAQINWRELIDLSWSKTGLEKVRDWAGFVMSPSSRYLLSHQPEKPSRVPKSVDIVIARFNVVVKWAVSEVLLTEDLFERVHCIQQYIRIAASCRKLRNFATMYQIATALVSADLTSLRDTWELVPPSDKAWLEEMETLVSPLKSFENVRREQEVVVPDAGGCIPFFGVYLNDLALNATRNPTVDKSPTLGRAMRDLKTTTFTAPVLNTQPGSKLGEEYVEPMINFERYQNAAAIVKTVLRLVESSKQYQFDVSPKLLSKCLWVCALGDEEIRARRKGAII